MSFSWCVGRWGMANQSIVSCLLVALMFSLAFRSESNDLQVPPALGYGKLSFHLPKPGSYALPILGTAADGLVVNTENKDITLHELMGDKVVLLSFIYSTCSDVNGCPLATAVFYKIKRALQQETSVGKDLRLITLSFNPEHDTSEAMARYGKGLQDKTIDWQFLTTRSEYELQPILQDYQQSVQKIVDQNGQFTGTFSHILRVYLIDKQKQIRNIYSVSYLHADTLINDVKTVLLVKDEEGRDRKFNHLNQFVFRAGDDKSNYASKQYRTQSIALTDRTGKPMDLLATIRKPALGLPRMSIPKSSPVTPQRVVLGKKLFYDRRLSINNTFSCAMCHIPEQGFSSNEMATAVGFEGRTVKRNSPTIYNVGYLSRLFHDGRESTLEQQVWAPLLAKNEMANPSIGYVIDKIKNLPDYNGMFEQAFNRPPSMQTIGQAIASYERTLNAADSDFDRWYFSNQPNSINDAAKRGFKLFTGKARCSVCHTIEEKNALFTDQQFHNTGIGYQNVMQSDTKNLTVQLAPGVFVDVDQQQIAKVSEKKPNDLGRYEVTLNPNDLWKYRTPSLRNVALTAPYMHDGSLANLEQVVRFYNRGGIANEGLDELLVPLHLSEQEILELVEFLFSLSGNQVDQLIADAYQQSVGDIGSH